MKTVRNMYNIRKAQGLSLAEIARRLEQRDPNAVKRPMLHAFEQGQCFTKQRTLEDLADILGSNIEDLIRMVEVPDPAAGRTLVGADVS
jgi:transcriptional regulator with XRE-family HTH domain